MLNIKTNASIDCNSSSIKNIIQIRRDVWLDSIKNMNEGLNILIDTDSEFKAICYFEGDSQEIHIFNN